MKNNIQFNRTSGKVSVLVNDNKNNKVLRNSSLLLIIFLTFSPTILAQEDYTILQNEEQLLNHVSKIYGADDLLINGRIYVPLHGLADGHPYFETYDWIMGTVFIKGFTYKNLKLKYDLELNDFVLFIMDDLGNKNYIVLNRHFVDSVHLGSYRFINASLLNASGFQSGYVELVYHRDFAFIIHHSKNFKNAFSESKPYGEYAEIKSVNYIVKDSVFTKLPTKKSFVKYFGKNKKEIQKFLKKNKIKYKKANSGELFKLLEYINENLS